MHKIKKNQTIWKSHLGTSSDIGCTMFILFLQKKVLNVNGFCDKESCAMFINFIYPSQLTDTYYERPQVMGMSVLVRCTLVDNYPEDQFWILRGIQFFDKFKFYLGQILRLYEAKSLTQYLTQFVCFIHPNKIPIVKQIGC